VVSEVCTERYRARKPGEGGARGETGIVGRFATYAAVGVEKTIKNNLYQHGGFVKKPWQTKTGRILGILFQTVLAMLALLFLMEGYVQQKVPVSPYGLHVFTDLWDRGYVRLTGTWVIEREKQYFPLQISEIQCRSDSKTCVESRAEVSGKTLIVHQDTYEIRRWDQHILIYVEDSAQCTDSVYTVSRDTKQASGLRSLKPGMESTCSDVTEELKLRLTNGFDVYWAMQQEARPIAVSATALVIILLWAGFRIRGIVKSPPIVA